LAQTVKGIKVDFEPNQELEKLFRSYVKAINLFLNIAYSNNITSLGRLNQFRQKVKEKCGITGYASVMALRDALAIYRSWRKRGGRKPKPKIRKPFLRLSIPYNAELENGRIRITIERGKYVWLRLKIGKYQQPFIKALNEGKLKLGEIVVKRGYIILTVKKESLPYQPEGYLALDINEKSINGVLYKNGEFSFLKWSLGKVYSLNQTYTKLTEKLQKKYPNRWALWRKVNRKRFKNRARKVDWHLHNITRQIVDFAEKEKALIILEDLKNIKNRINKRKLKKNKYSGKVQPHRTKPKSLLGRLNRACFRKIEFMINYKAKWNNIPLTYIKPHYTSRICPRCGWIDRKGLRGHVFTCKCGFKLNRHYVACLNLLNRYMTGYGSPRDWGRMKAINGLTSQVNLVGTTQVPKS